jgi:phosphoribosylanthranilate isomerase
MRGKLIVKVCGMRDAANIREVDGLTSERNGSAKLLAPDWMGFIFWPESSRYVSEVPDCMPKHAKRVGVFVDEHIDEVIRIAKAFALDIIQLHGHESPEYLRQLLSIGGSATAIVKAFSIATVADLEQTAGYEGLADYFLFDTKGKSVGGNGEQFDWSVLNAYKGRTPFLLSGGIGPDDASRIRALFENTSYPSSVDASSTSSVDASSPESVECSSSASVVGGFPADRCIGVDLNSRFETAPALKDVNKLKQFIEELEEKVKTIMTSETSKN